MGVRVPDRWLGDAQAVDRFESHVDRGGRADRDVRAEQIIVDRRGPADDLQTLACKRQRACLRAVAADHHKLRDVGACVDAHQGGRPPEEPTNL